MRTTMILTVTTALALALTAPIVPAHALDVSASVGGVSADVSVGGGDGVSADVSAGGASGVNASADVGGAGSSTGSSGGGLNADVNASVGRSGSVADVNANAALGGGRGVQADVDARVGAETALGVSIGGGGNGAPGGPGTGGPGSNGPGTPGAIPVSQYFASQDAAGQARMKRTCRMVLNQPETYERDLAELCRVISRL